MSLSSFESVWNQQSSFLSNTTITDKNENPTTKRRAETSESNISKWSRQSESDLSATANSSAQHNSKMLLQRTSSFDSLNICEHCVHDHMRPCCMYVYDDFTDIHNYSMFKREVETPYWMKTNSDAFNRFVGGTTPKKFPLFTEKEDQVVNKKVKVQSKPKNPPEPQPPQSVVFVRQYFWPLFLPDQFNNHPFETLIRNNELNHLHYPIGHTTPCVMRQIAIPIDAYCSNRNDINTYQQHPQVIETHSWVPWWMLR